MIKGVSTSPERAPHLLSTLLTCPPHPCLHRPPQPSTHHPGGTCRQDGQEAGWGDTRTGEGPIQTQRKVCFGLQPPHSRQVCASAPYPAQPSLSPIYAIFLPAAPDRVVSAQVGKSYSSARLHSPLLPHEGRAVSEVRWGHPGSCFLYTPPRQAGGPPWALWPSGCPDAPAEEGPRDAAAAAPLEAGPGHQN